MLHGRHSLANDFTAVLSFVPGRRDRSIGLLGAFSRIGDCRRDLVERRCGLFKRGGLLLGAAGEIVGGARQFRCAGTNGIGVCVYTLECLLQLAHCGIEVRAKLFVFPWKCLADAERQSTI